MKCSICNEKITADADGWDGGHNAKPINNGRCCGSCNENIVTPSRFDNYMAQNAIRNIPREIKYIKQDMLKMMDKIGNLEQSIINLKYLLKNNKWQLRLKRKEL